MPDFLLELFSEEIPARMQARAAADLDRLMGEALAAERLAPEVTATHVTPRRLVYAASGLAARQPDLAEERKGPREDAPQQAIDGFLRSTGLTLDACELRDTPKGRTWFAVIHRPGRASEAVLGEVIARVLAGFPWPKSMCWGETKFRWVRPLHHVLAVFDGRPLPGAFAPDEGLSLAFTDKSRGHRFLAPDPFPVAGLTDLKAGLAGAHVVLDREDRRRAIAEGAARCAEAAGLRLRDDPGLIDEVAGLVEWPVVLAGRIDEAFLDVPEEVLVTAMRTHQRYFACVDGTGRLAPRFVMVANTEARDGGAAIVAGNERVLRARLSDARFFWDQDRAKCLDDHLPALAEIVFHAKLGSMADKVARLERLAARLAEAIPDADPMAAERAATLAKADLVTGMVGEFPELQGVMGRYYALAHGEDAAVADAVAAHYAPLGPSDDCPSAPVAVAVALADKLDTLAGFFAIGETPSGRGDPYALRRAALGVIRLVTENGLRLGLSDLFRSALAAYPEDVTGIYPQEHVDSLVGFFADRLKVALRDRGVRHDLVDAVFALGGEDDLVRLIDRVTALGQLVDSPDGANLLTAYRRAANIVRIESKKDKIAGYGDPDRARLAEPAERALADGLSASGDQAARHAASEDFAGAMTALAALRAPVDAFFDQVTVNADDAALRRNRLALLQHITATLDRIADFSKIQG